MIAQDPHEPSHLRGQCAEERLPVSCSSGPQAPSARKPNHVQQNRCLCSERDRLNIPHSFILLTHLWKKNCVCWITAVDDFYYVFHWKWQVEFAPLPVQGWMKQSWAPGGHRAAAMAWDPAGKAHPAQAGGGRTLPGDQDWARRGSSTLCCSVANWKTGQKVHNKHRDSINIL